MAHPELTLVENHPLPNPTKRYLVGTTISRFHRLGVFIVYATFRVFWGQHYLHDPYLSPFYSPLLFSPDGSHSWLGVMPEWMPTFITPAVLILWAPSDSALRATTIAGHITRRFGQTHLHVQFQNHAKAIAGNIHFH